MTRSDFHWLVGILEGEGCFSFRMTKRSYEIGRRSFERYPELAIGVQMSDADVVARVAKLLGVLPQGPYIIHYKGRICQPAYNVQLRGTKAKAMMQMVLPFMSARRQATITWALQTYKQAKGDK